MDRVLVKDRLESKLRHEGPFSVYAGGWIGSLSKIGLRANSDSRSSIISRHELDRVLVKDRLESKLRLFTGPTPGSSSWIGSLSKIGLRANSDSRCSSSCTYWLDRVLVKDRLESKLRLTLQHEQQTNSWIGSLSKIGLRANSDLRVSRSGHCTLDRVLVKDRLESKLRLVQL